jgi:gamma-glutamyltranspeptidase/glutathione hydrolase
VAVTNHPLASAVAAEMLLAGGNAVDAAVAALFALSVVEPMMVGPLGGGLMHLRVEGGPHLVLDGLGTAPRAARPDLYTPVSATLPDYGEAEGRANRVGPLAVAVPGALASWCEALARFGTVPLADAVAPAIRLAERGFRATPYLTGCVAEHADDLARDPLLAQLYLRHGAPLPPGTLVVQPECADSLRLIARDGPATLYDGPLGDALAGYMARAGGLVDRDDLRAYAVTERAPIQGTYRGYEIAGPPPPSSGGVHVVQMLNILEGYDLRAMSFGSAGAVHLVAEALKIAFADRAVATADPAFVRPPVGRLVSKGYAAERSARIRPDRAQDWAPGVAPAESADTTHVTVADSQGTIACCTQTVNGLFGARFTVPGTGLVANNYMYNFDPHPGRALSVASGKRVFTSMAPLIALRGGRPAYALGLPGGLRIFGCAMQALVNLIEHGMSLQEAVEAPRVWTQGGPLEIEPGIPDETAAVLERRGHAVQRVPRIGGGMNAIAFEDDGTLVGAACWRADGTPVAIAGGLARPGVRFSA